MKQNRNAVYLKRNNSRYYFYRVIKDERVKAKREANKSIDDIKK